MSSVPNAVFVRPFPLRVALACLTEAATYRWDEKWSDSLLDVLHDPLFEQLELRGQERVGLSDDGNNINSGRQSTHELDVDLPEGMSGGLDEVEKGMDPGRTTKEGQNETQDGKGEGRRPELTCCRGT